jgi:hypothetical protein
LIPIPSFPSAREEIFKYVFELEAPEKGGVHGLQSEYGS